jgi:hypothetical protein
VFGVEGAQAHGHGGRADMGHELDHAGVQRLAHGAADVEDVDDRPGIGG